MKRPLFILAIAILAFSVACSASKSKNAPEPTSTLSDAAKPTAVPGSPTPVTVTRTKVTPENAGSLNIQTQGSLNSIEGLRWSEDSTQLLAYNQKAVSSLEDKPGAQLKTVASATGNEGIMSIATPGGGSYVTRVDNNDFSVRKLSTGDVIKTVKTDAQFSNVVLNRDGSMAAVQRQDKIAVDLYQLPAGTLIKQLSGFETAAPVYSVRFTPDSKSLIWLARAQVQLQDIITGSFSPKIEHEDFVSGLTLKPSSPTLVTGAGSSIFVWDTTTGQSQQTLPQDGIVSGVSFSPDGNLLAVSSNSGVTFWDARQPAYVKLTTLKGNFRQVSFSPDGTALATSDETGQAEIWAPPTGPAK